MKWACLYMILLNFNNKKQQNNLVIMKVGDEIKFIIESSKNPPTLNDNGGFCIAFVPMEGFQWCRYSNGSKTWKSMITGINVNATEWLKKIE